MPPFVYRCVYCQHIKHECHNTIPNKSFEIIQANRILFEIIVYYTIAHAMWAVVYISLIQVENNEITGET